MPFPRNIKKQGIRQGIYRFLGVRSRTLDQEKYEVSKLSMGILLLMAVLPHVFFLFFFNAAGIASLTVLNAWSMAHYVAVFLVLRTDRMLLAAGLIALEVVVSSVMTVAVMGLSAQAHWYLVLLLIPFFYYVDCRLVHRVLICVVVVLVMALCHVYAWTVPSPYAGSPYTVFLHVFNSFLVVLALIMEIFTDSIARSVFSHTQNRKIELLRQQSYRDPLTNLFNRRFADKLFADMSRERAAERQGQNFCVAMIDIDDFKSVNDLYGHAAGDELLKVVSCVLQNYIRKEDVLFRWGGEEFLVIFRDVGLTRARLIAEGLVERVAQASIEQGAARISVQVTIGIARGESPHVDSAIAAADANLYEGKRLGKNRVVG